MKILALETATEACSVALLNGDVVIARYVHQPQQQAQLVLPMVNDVLQEAALPLTSLDAIAFGRGPGSFTGLRVAASVTQGLAVASDLPVVPVSTLACMAQGMQRRFQASRVLTALDARMQEVYWAEYVLQNDLMVLNSVEQVLPPAQVPLPAAGVYMAAGSGWQAYADILQTRFEGFIDSLQADVWPQAEDMLPLAKALYQQGAAVAAEQAIPVYLRDKVAKSKAERSA